MQNFNYHSHTYRCVHADLDYTDEEYIQDYIKMGFKKVAITDHCPEKNKIDKRQHMRMEYGQKEEYLNSIQKLKEKYANQIEIESGYEVEYLPGEEENIRELKEETDKIVLGQHFIYDDNKQLKIFGKKEEFTNKELIRYAEYVDKAMELNIPDIIAHPDIYMLKRKEFGDIENKVAHMICKSAEKYKIPLEINLNNIFANTYYENRTLNNEPIEIQRPKLANVAYPCKGFWEVASQYNIKVLYGLDAHHRTQISLWPILLEFTKDILGEELLNKLDFIQEKEDL